MNRNDFKSIFSDVTEILDREISNEDKLQKVCELLKEKVYHYDWVGFYLADDQKKELTLGPYAGAATDHKRIQFGEGICGQAAENEETFLCQDVNEESNYLSCSPYVKSEIVLPIKRDGIVIGELDIDSHIIAPFTDDDEWFLERVCISVAGLL